MLHTLQCAGQPFTTENSVNRAKVEKPSLIQNSVQAGVSSEKFPLGPDSLSLRTSVAICSVIEAGSVPSSA